MMCHRYMHYVIILAGVLVMLLCYIGIRRRTHQDRFADADYYLRGDGTWVPSLMLGANAAAAGTSGAVPAPAAGAHNSYLRGDGKWVPSLMSGANAAAAGTSGAVPAPAAGSQNSYLRGDGTWQPANNKLPPTAQYIMTTLVAATGVNMSSGANIAFDTMIAQSGTAIVAVPPAMFLLRAGNTYRCTGELLGANVPLTTVWVNIDTSTPFGTPGSTTTTRGQYPAAGYIACTAPTRVALRVVAGTTVASPLDGIGLPKIYARALIELVSVDNSISTVPPAAIASNSVAAGGYLQSIVVLSGGTGYTSSSPPLVIIAAPPGAGTQATAVAIVSGGTVTNVIIIDAGGGYTADPVVTIPPAPVSGAVAATAIAYAMVSGLESPSNCGNLSGTTSGAAYIMADGSVRVLGQNVNGCQALGPLNISYAAPQPIGWLETISPIPAAVKIWPAYVQKYVLGADGYLYAAGVNTSGSLGTGTTANASRLTRVLLPRGLVKFACSNGFTGSPGASATSCLALLGNGTLYGWGCNAWGELGTGNTSAVLSPTRITFAGANLDAKYTVADMVVSGTADGGTTTYILLTNGQVLATGCNYMSQCANGNTANQYVFGWVQVVVPLVSGPYSVGQTAASATYIGPGATYLTATGATIVAKVAGTYNIVLTGNNYNVGGNPQVYISRTGAGPSPSTRVLAHYVFPTTGNPMNLAATVSLAVGDTVYTTTSSSVNGSYVVYGAAILGGITQLAVSGADQYATALFFTRASAAVKWYAAGFGASYGYGNGGISQSQYAVPGLSPFAPSDPPVSILAAGNAAGATGATGASMGAITASGNLWAWGNNTILPAAVSPTPVLSWPSGGIKKACMHSYNDSGMCAILLADGTVYYNGGNPNYVGGIGATGSTNGQWALAYIRQKDIIDIMFVGDTNNPNLCALTSAGDVYIAGWNTYGQLGNGTIGGTYTSFAKIQF